MYIQPVGLGQRQRERERERERERRVGVSERDRLRNHELNTQRETFRKGGLAWHDVKKS